MNQSLNKSLHRKFLHRQCGAVLIMALLIVALVVGLSIKFAGDYQLGLARAEGRWHGAQARAYTYSAEGAVIKMLEKDDPSYDSPDETWALEMPIEVDGGKLFISVRDADSLFNLNSLISQKPLDPNKDPMDATRYTAPQRMFIRLLQTFPELVRSPAEAAGILEAVVDWTDGADGPSGSNGAEEDYYLSQPDPYRPANMVFRSLEELQMIRGISPELMRELRPFVTVLESADGPNINTMSPRLFRCVNVKTDLTPLDEAKASSLQTPPSSGHYSNLSEFDTALNSVFGAGSDVDKESLMVTTKFFWLTTEAQIGDQRRTGRSLLKRGTPTFTVARREEVY